MDKKLETIVKALDSKKGFDIEVLETKGLTSVADYFVIASGNTNTQVKALADEVEYKLHLEGIEPRQIEGKATGWILLDYYDTMVHVFSVKQREYYGLGKLWADAKRIDISDIVTE